MSHEVYEFYMSVISGTAQLSALVYGPAVHRSVKAERLNQRKRSGNDKISPGIDRLIRRGGNLRCLAGEVSTHEARVVTDPHPLASQRSRILYVPCATAFKSSIVIRSAIKQPSIISRTPKSARRLPACLDRFFKNRRRIIFDIFDVRTVGRQNPGGHQLRSQPGTIRMDLGTARINPAETAAFVQVTARRGRINYFPAGFVFFITAAATALADGFPIGQCLRLVTGWFLHYS